jgi:uncharacterized membrane protein
MSVTETGSNHVHSSQGSFALAGYLLGLALGGFFDGIMLHQVLQWHHLLSLVDEPSVQDIRVQILADGLFHVLMYAVALLGLVFLWRSRGRFAEPGARSWLAGTMLLGFGLWNVIDVGVFHWIMGIHRIRVDVPNPMFWDVLWLTLFGLLFLVAGWIVRARSGLGKPGRMDSGTSLASIISAGVILAGLMAAVPPADADTTLVLFESDATPGQVFRAFDATDARVLWADKSGTVWAVRLDPAASTSPLYRHGAILVSNSTIALGCLSWLRT